MTTRAALFHHPWDTIKHALRGLPERVAALGWPAVAAALLVPCAIAMWAISGWLAYETGRLQRGAVSIAHTVPPAPTFTHQEENEPKFPHGTQYTRDLGTLLDIMHRVGLNTGLVGYRSITHAKLSITERHIDLRINDDYPKLKRFLATTLDTLPNATLQEIQVERKYPSTEQTTIFLKLVLFYWTEMTEPHQQPPQSAESIRLKPRYSR
ncbi:MAG: hypothetical protein ACT4NV_14580 [Rhodoferax sp.]